jgi:hypothetical protein
MFKPERQRACRAAHDAPNGAQVVSNLSGMLMSGLAIWTTSIYQIWAGSKQKEYQVRYPALSPRYRCQTLTFTC